MIDGKRAVRRALRQSCQSRLTKDYEHAYYEKNWVQDF